MSNETRTAIRKGSKSFFLASLFFGHRTREACWVLYRWCRHCDDQVDNGGSAQTLIELRMSTDDGLNLKSADVLFSELGKVCETHGIPHTYPHELLNGFEKDVRGVSLEQPKDLEDYAYQVAGVVGLMMSHIMGADMPSAISPAKSLGNAMQLTNIARDVKEDFENGRIYLPRAWLKESELEPEGLLDSSQRSRLFELVKRLLARADELYRDGYAGLHYLPFRAALAVSIAGSIYSSIGRKILARGESALDERIYVTLPEKLFLTLEGIVRVLAIVPRRLAMRSIRANTQ